MVCIYYVYIKIKTCRRVKNRAKIMQCALAITLAFSILLSCLYLL